jgi:hypothetical protein
MGTHERLFGGRQTGWHRGTGYRETLSGSPAAIRAPSGGAKTAARASVGGTRPNVHASPSTFQFVVLRSVELRMSAPH